MAPRLVDPEKIVTCPKCGRSGPARDLLYFYKSGPNVGRPIGLSCRDCRPHRRPLADPTVVLTCSKCGVSGPACDLFYFHKSGPQKGSITQSHCKACEYERVQEHKDRRPKFGPPVPKGHRARMKPRRSNLRVVDVDGVAMRPCTRCGETKPLAAFTKQKRENGLFSYASHCKACRTAFEKAKREAGERVIKDPERVKQVSAAWRAANPEKKRMDVRRRRARIRENGGEMISLEEWQEIQAEHEHRCAYCDVYARGELTMDHILPVSRGGTSDVENIWPACGKHHNNCNARKASLTGVEFMRSARHPLAEAVA